MEDNIISVTVSGVVAWTTLFLITRKIFQKRSFGFCGRLVSIIHALQIVFMASYFVPDWTNPIPPSASTSTPLQMKILAVNVAYYIYDLGRYQFDLKNIKIDMVIHHMITLVGLVACLAYKMCGLEALVELWIGEVPGPFHHWRELLKDLGYKDTNLNVTVDVLFVAAFTFSKMIYGTYVTYLILTAKYPVIIKAAVLTMQLLNYFWIYKIVRISMRKYLFKDRRTSSRKIHSN